LPCETSWRVVLLSDNPGDLLTSNILPNLNPPCKLKDTSWIKPGVSMWDWRGWGGKDKDGFVYSLDMESWRRSIDFASENGINYLLLDAGWYGPERDEESNPVTARKCLLIQPSPDKPHLQEVPAPDGWEALDIPKLIKYGKARNVGIFLYHNDRASVNFDIENTFKTYNQWGAVGVKYGFMQGSGQEKVLKTRKVIEACARNKLMVDFHDHPVPPSGDERTYPNCVAREFCHAQADARTSFTPSHFCKMLFTNLLAGSLDMTNGFLTLNDLSKNRPKVFKPLFSTVVGETARVMVVYSALAVIPDTPASYREKQDLFEFISKLPMTWDETKIVNAKIGEYITTVRRSDDQWFVASNCDEQGVELPINMNFLEEGKEYVATLYEDAPDSHYQTNKEACAIKTVALRKGDLITAKLAPGGGHCMWIRPL
jgi:hypothetical protein